MAVFPALALLALYSCAARAGRCGCGNAAAQEPVSALLSLLALGSRAPFLRDCRHRTLAQRWFSHTQHADAGDPYFLYVASNVGSMIAL